MDLGTLRAAIEDFGDANSRVAAIIGMNPLDLVIRSGSETVGKLLIRRGHEELFGEWSRLLATVQHVREEADPDEDRGAFLVLLAAHLS